jgi:hypothetical protein
VHHITTTTQEEKGLLSSQCARVPRQQPSHTVFRKFFLKERMQTRVLFFVLAAALAVVALASDDGDVIKLTKDNFDTIVNAEDIILVKFFAPW